MLSQAELERPLWGAADILRGTVDAAAYKQYIFGLLFYKRLCDVWDEAYEALLKDTETVMFAHLKRLSHVR